MAQKFGAATLITESVWVVFRVGGGLGKKKKAGQIYARAFIQDNLGAWAFANILRQSKVKDIKFVFEFDTTG